MNGLPETALDLENVLLQGKKLWLWFVNKITTLSATTSEEVRFLKLIKKTVSVHTYNFVLRLFALSYNPVTYDESV